MSEIQYKVVDGTFYHAETPDPVVKILEHSRTTGARLRLFLGDTATGRDWLEENDVCGRIGRSTGEIKIPLLIKTARSMGGGGVLDHCIVRIIDTRTGKVIYSHPKYNRAKFTTGPAETPGYSTAVYADGKLHAQFKKETQAARFIKKMAA